MLLNLFTMTMTLKSDKDNRNTKSLTHFMKIDAKDLNETLKPEVYKM